jgi:hypothetical protein
MKRISSLFKRSTDASQTKSTDSEANALFFMVGVFVVALLASFMIFGGNSVPVFGRGGSVGTTAIVLGSLTAFLGYFFVSYRHMPKKNLSVLKRTRLILTNVALAFIHAAIVFLLMTVVFYTLDSAFTGLMIDELSSSVIVASSSAVFAYGTYLVAERQTTLNLSTALAIFLVVGALTSMITSTDPYWWQNHLSYLGGGYSFSAYAFEVTLAMGGIVLMCIADFIANDFERIKQKRGTDLHTRANAVRIILLLIGLFLAFVGLFRWNVNPIIHNLAASGMVVLFLALIIGLPYFVPMFSRAFFVFSYGLMGALLVCVYLYAGIAYFNLTAFEILAFIIVFGWLVVFVRQIAAALDDQSDIKRSVEA